MDAQYGYKFYTIIQYRETDVPAGLTAQQIEDYKKQESYWAGYNDYVLYKTNNWSNLAQHQNVQAWSNDGGHHEGYFFELDKAYDIRVTFCIYDDSDNYVFKSSNVGSIPAATPRIYDPTDAHGAWTGSAYDGSTGHIYNNNGTAHDFYIYFDSVNMNNNVFVNYKFWKWTNTSVAFTSATDAQKADPANWTDVSSSFSGHYQTYMCENSGQAGGLQYVTVPTGDPMNPYKNYPIKGYNENNNTTTFTGYGVNVERINLYADAPFDSGSYYRIAFDTDYRYVKPSDISYGTYGTYNTSTVGSSTLSYDTYHLSNATDNTGFIYIKG
jgi:hypothetical protein